VGSSPTFGYSYSKLNQSSCSFALFGAPSCCFLAVLVFGGERATGRFCIVDRRGCCVVVLRESNGKAAVSVLSFVLFCSVWRCMMIVISEWRAGCILIDDVGRRTCLCCIDRPRGRPEKICRCDSSEPFQPVMMPCFKAPIDDLAVLMRKGYLPDRYHRRVYMGNSQD
jgi:hypothetical protein